MQCRNHICAHCVLLCSGVLSRDSSLTETCRSKKRDAEVPSFQTAGLCGHVIAGEKMKSVTKVLSIRAAKEER